jgi:predicted membrane GTPase involved in stress response
MQDRRGIHRTFGFGHAAASQLVPLLGRGHVFHDQGEAVRVGVVVGVERRSGVIRPATFGKVR